MPAPADGGCPLALLGRAPLGDHLDVAAAEALVGLHVQPGMCSWTSYETMGREGGSFFGLLACPPCLLAIFANYLKFS